MTSLRELAARVLARDTRRDEAGTRAQKRVPSTNDARDTLVPAKSGQIRGLNHGKPTMSRCPEPKGWDSGTRFGDAEHGTGQPRDKCRHCGEAVDWTTCDLRPGLVFANGSAAHLDCYERAEVERSRAALSTVVHRRADESEDALKLSEAVPS